MRRLVAVAGVIATLALGLLWALRDGATRDAAPRPADAAGAASPPLALNSRRAVHKNPDGGAGPFDAGPPEDACTTECAEAEVRQALDGGRLTGFALYTIDPISQQAIKEGVREKLRPRLTECGKRLHSRHPIREAIKFNVHFVASATEERGKISDVRPDEWPAQLDDEVRTCILDAFSGLDFESDGFQFSYPVSYPVVFAPSE